MWTKEGHSKVLERVDHVCLMMRIIQKKAVGSNSVAERWYLKEANPWEGREGENRADPGFTFEGERGTTLGMFDDI